MAQQEVRGRGAQRRTEARSVQCVARGTLHAARQPPYQKHAPADVRVAAVLRAQHAHGHARALQALEEGLRQAGRAGRAAGQDGGGQLARVAHQDHLQSCGDESGHC